ncbi:hypothetical protein ACIA8O_39935 [Kitasatospora sp. NPDC051853]|uniref:hypothetical protein n=1 Tax=Kitasatospora sp. NPDC051853 TaxID=3364058 RepID=UPI0037B2891E
MRPLSVWLAYWLTRGRLHRLGVKLRAAAALYRKTDPYRPENPTNGHPFTCLCFPCAVYWDTAAGTATYNSKPK